MGQFFTASLGHEHRLGVSLRCRNRIAHDHAIRHWLIRQALVRQPLDQLPICGISASPTADHRLGTGHHLTARGSILRDDDPRCRLTPDKIRLNQIHTARPNCPTQPPMMPTRPGGVGHERAGKDNDYEPVGNAAHGTPMGWLGQGAPNWKHASQTYPRQPTAKPPPAGTSPPSRGESASNTKSHRHATQRGPRPRQPGSAN